MKRRPSYEELKLRIRELEQSEERYRGILDNMQEAYYEVDLKGNFTLFNASAVKRLGYTDDEMRGMNFRRFVDRENAKKVLESYGSVFSTGKPITGFDWEVVCKNGERIPVESSVSLMLDAAGKAVGFTGVVREITDRKKAEEALRSSEEKYRNILENMQEGYVEMDLRGNFTFFNDSLCRITGYGRDEMLGMGYRQIVSSETAQRMLTLFRTIYITGEPEYIMDFEVVCKDGTTKANEMSAALIRDGSGQPIGFRGVVRDITPRKRAEDALRQSEERFRDLAGLLPDAVYETDRTGRLIFANEAVFEKFRYTRDELMAGLKVSDVVIPEDRARLEKGFERILSGERIGLREFTAVRKDGTTFPALIHSTVIMKGGVPCGARGFLIDISEKKTLEAQLIRAQKMEALGTLAGGIAHDFNNLLMGILGNTSLMLTKIGGSHPFHDRLKNIEEYVYRGSDLTKQFLGFARGGKYEVKSTHLGDFVIKSSEMFGRTRKEVRIHRKVEDGLWTVEVDRSQIEQVLLNLFVNAWQAMPGGGDLYLTVENTAVGEEAAAAFGADPGRYVRVSVADTGVGMDPAVRERIFEPFFTTKGKGRGTGLGLASVYGIVKNHKGFITVESEKGVGTAFLICFPASDKPKEDEAKANGKIRGGNETVLLVDDEKMILDVGSKMLSALGYTVVTAAGGREGVEVYAQRGREIDLVVLDMIMPDLGGKETFDRLREIDPDVRILLSSGYSIDGTAKGILDKGCAGFIQKPFNITEIALRIREVLDSRQLG